MRWRVLLSCLALALVGLVAATPARAVDPEPPDRVDTVDLYVIVDRSGSMSSEINNIKANLAAAVNSLQCPPQGTGPAQSCIPDLWAGVGTVGYAGSGASAFQHYADLQPDPNLGSLPVTEPTGSNTKEALTYAAYAAVTGAAGYPFGLTVPARSSCAGSPAALAGHATYGYPCFREGALPLVVLVTDEAPLTGPDTWATPNWDAVVRPAMVAAGARLVGVTGDGATPATLTDLRRMATDTRAVDWNGAPVAFDGGGANATTALKNAVLTVVSAAVPPSVAMTSPSSTFQLDTMAALGWTATDGNGLGLASHDIRYRSAGVGDAAYGEWVHPSELQGLPADSDPSSAAVELAAGARYCFSVRSTDTSGLSSAWSPERCTGRPLDDRALKPATRGWSKGKGQAYYGQTFRKSVRRGATLVLKGVNADQLALVATTCPKCGKVDVLIGRRLLDRVNLKSETKRNQELILVPAFEYRTGTVKLKVRTSGKPVIVDGLAIARP